MPLLFDACSKGLISLKQIVELTRKNIETIFNIPHQEDTILVDLNQSETLEQADLKTKCGWSPYVGLTLKGKIIYTIVKGKVFHHG